MEEPKNKLNQVRKQLISYRQRLRQWRTTIKRPPLTNSQSTPLK